MKKFISKLITIFTIFAMGSNAFAGDFFKYNSQRKLILPSSTVDYKALSSDDRSRLTSLLEDDSIKKAIGEKTVDKFSGEAWWYDGTFGWRDSHKDAVQSGLKDILEKLHKLQDDPKNAGLFFKSRSDEEFNFDGQKDPAGTPKFCAAYPQITKNNLKAFYDGDKSVEDGVAYSGCHGTEPISIPVKKLVTDFSEISDFMMRKKEQKAKEHMMIVVANAMLEQRKRYQGMYDNYPKFDPELKSCLKRKSSNWGYGRNKHEAAFPGLKKVLDKIHSEEASEQKGNPEVLSKFNNYNIGLALVAKNHLDKRNQLIQDHKRFEEDSRYLGGRACVLAKPRPDRCDAQKRKENAAKAKKAQQELDQQNSILQLLMGESPSLFKIENFGGYFSGADVRVEPSDYMSSIMKVPGADKLAGDLDKEIINIPEGKSYKAARADAIKKLGEQHGKEIEELAAKINTDKTVKESGNDAVYKQISKIDDSLKAICENDGESLQQYTAMFPNVLNEVANSASSKGQAVKDVEDVQAGLCSLYRKDPPDKDREPSAVQKVVGWGLVLGGAALGIATFWTGVGAGAGMAIAATGSAMALGGSAVFAGHAYNNYVDAKTREANGVGMLSTSWGDVRKVIDAQNDRINSRNETITQVAFAAPDMIGLGLLANSARVAKVAARAGEVGGDGVTGVVKLPTGPHGGGGGTSLVTTTADAGSTSKALTVVEDAGRGKSTSTALTVVEDAGKGKSTSTALTVVEDAGKGKSTSTALTVVEDATKAKTVPPKVVTSVDELAKAPTEGSALRLTAVSERDGSAIKGVSHTPPERIGPAPMHDTAPIIDPKRILPAPREVSATAPKALPKPSVAEKPPVLRLTSSTREEASTVKSVTHTPPKKVAAAPAHDGPPVVTHARVGARTSRDIVEGVEKSSTLISKSQPAFKVADIKDIPKNIVGKRISWIGKDGVRRFGVVEKVNGKSLKIAGRKSLLRFENINGSSISAFDDGRRLASAADFPDNMIGEMVSFFGPNGDRVEGVLRGQLIRRNKASFVVRVPKDPTIPINPADASTFAVKRIPYSSVHGDSIAHVSLGNANGLRELAGAKDFAKFTGKRVSFYSPYGNTLNKDMYVVGMNASKKGVILREPVAGKVFDAANPSTYTEKVFYFSTKRINANSIAVTERSVEEATTAASTVKSTGTELATHSGAGLPVKHPGTALATVEKDSHLPVKRPGTALATVEKDSHLPVKATGTDVATDGASTSRAVDKYVYEGEVLPPEKPVVRAAPKEEGNIIDAEFTVVKEEPLQLTGLRVETPKPSYNLHLSDWWSRGKSALRQAYEDTSQLPFWKRFLKTSPHVVGPAARAVEAAGDLKGPSPANSGGDTISFTTHETPVVPIVPTPAVPTPNPAPAATQEFKTGRDDNGDKKNDEEKKKKPVIAPAPQGNPVHPQYIQTIGPTIQVKQGTY